MKKKTTKSMAIGFLFVSVLGTAAHFFYDWSYRTLLVGLFTPVNESVWEHMKLLFFPMLLYTYLIQFTGRQTGALPAHAFYTGTLAGTWLIPVLFYTTSGILGFHSTVLDITIFFVSVLAAFFISYKQKVFSVFHRSLLCCLILFQTLAFFLFTLYPPPLGLFRSPG